MSIQTVRWQLLLAIWFSNCIFSCSIYYKMRKIDCYPNPKYLQNTSCSVKPINWTLSHLIVDTDVVDILRNISVRIRSFYKDYSNQYKPFVINFEFNLCKILKSPHSGNFLAKYTVEHLMKDSNLNHSCPITGHLCARNFTFNEIMLPKLQPQYYKIEAKFFEGADTLGQSNVFVEVLDVAYGSGKGKNRTKG